MSKRKKIIVLSCMIALLAATAVFNFVLSGNGNVDKSVETATYFSEYRSQRSSIRNEQILQLDQIINSSSDGTAVRTNALEQKLELTAVMEEELYLETLVKACGFTDVVVKINSTTNNVNVILDKEANQDEAVKIYRIISAESEISPENVTIMHI